MSYGRSLAILASTGGTPAAPPAGPSALGLGIFSAAGSIAGAVFSTLQANELNKAIEEQAERQLGQINTQIHRTRVKAMLDSMANSRIGRAAIESATNQLGNAEGISVTQSLASMASDVFRNTAAIEMDLRNSIQDYEFEKQMVVSAAKSQLQTPIMAGLRGAIGGLMQGAGIYSSLMQLEALKNQAAMSDDVSDLRRRLGVLGVHNAGLQSQQYQESLLYQMGENSKLGVTNALMRSRSTAAGTVMNRVGSQNPGAAFGNLSKWWVR